MATYASVGMSHQGNDLKKHQIPDGTFSFVMIKNSEKINRTTYEIYDEKSDNSSKERISNK